MSDRTDFRYLDEWLEAQFESTVSGDLDPILDFSNVTLGGDEDDDGDDLLDRLYRSLPSGFHSVDQLETAPLQHKIDQALADLSEQLAGGHTAHFHQVITFYAKFHHYSLANAILIMLQKPDAEVVAGYRRWQELGRQVRKDTKAAQIWCPVLGKRDDEAEGLEESDERDRVVGYRTGYVFSDKDLIDAETLQIPSLRSQLPDTQAELLAFIKDRAIASGVSIREVERIAGAEGYYDRGRHQVVLQSGRDSHNQVLILLHEWAHALFHQRPDAATWPKAQKEFEAESVTMVMANLLGLEAPAAADYLLVYGATPEQLKQSFGHVHTLVGAMSKHLGMNSLSDESGPRDAQKRTSGRREWKPQPVSAPST